MVLGVLGTRLFKKGVGKLKVKYLSHKLEEKIVDGKLIAERIDYKFNENELFVIMERFYSKIESDLLGKDLLKTEVVCEHFSFEGLKDGTWKPASLDTDFYIQPILDVFIEDGVLHITLLQNQPEQELNVWIEPDFSGSINKIKYKKATFKWIDKEKLLEEIKELKKSELSQRCQEDIEHGFYFDQKKYSYGINNQQNFSDTMRLFDNNMIDSIGWNAYAGKKKVRIQLNKEEFKQVYLAGVKHKINCLTRLNDVLYAFVDAAENKETIARIYWNTELPAEELSLKEGESIEERT